MHSETFCDGFFPRHVAAAWKWDWLWCCVFNWLLWANSSLAWRETLWAIKGVLSALKLDLFTDICRPGLHKRLDIMLRKRSNEFIMTPNCGKVKRALDLGKIAIGIVLISMRLLLCSLDFPHALTSLWFLLAVKGLVYWIVYYNGSCWNVMAIVYWNIRCTYLWTVFMPYYKINCGSRVMCSDWKLQQEEKVHFQDRDDAPITQKVWILHGQS